VPKIVISYRRADTEEITGRVFDRLCDRFGRRSVFMDIDNIPAGKDFRTHVDDALEKADVMLAIVGPGWVNVQRGHSTLHTDWVGVEVESALKKKLRIIPVLVRGAKMPEPEALPSAMRGFVYLNAVRVDGGQDFNAHMRRLISEIDNRNPWLARGLAACLAIVLAGAGGIALWRFIPQPESSTQAPALAREVFQPVSPVVRPPALTETPRTQTAAEVPAPQPVPIANPAPALGPAPSAPAASPAPAAPAVAEAPPRPAPVKEEIASAPPPRPPAAPAATTRTVTAIEGEAFMLCGQSDFTVSWWQPRASAPVEAALRRRGMMMADGLSTQLVPGKPKTITENCEVTFVELRAGFKPVAVLEERRKN